MFIKVLLFYNVYFSWHNRLLIRIQTKKVENKNLKWVRLYILIRHFNLKWINKSYMGYLE